MLIIAIAAHLMNVYDLLCTMYLVKEYGMDIEGNPIGKILLKNKAVTVIVKLVAMAAVIALIYSLCARLFFRIALFIIFGIYALLTVYHTVILIHLKINKL